MTDAPTGKERLDESREAQRQREAALLATWIDGHRLTADGALALKWIAATLLEATRGHDDNTGGLCRVDLADHDCCTICNQAQDALALLARYEAP